MKQQSKKILNSSFDKNAILLKALHYGDVFILYQNCDFIYQWAENLPIFLQNKWHEACLDSDIYPENICKNIAILREKILKSAESQSLKICLFDENQQAFWYQLKIECHYDEKGKLIGYVTTACNISPLQQCNENLIGLQLEVNHRSKNLFAIIQSIANQTGQHSSNIAIFLTKFRGRIQSLANALDLVTERDKYGTAFDRLIKAQIAQYYPVEAMPLNITGVNPNMMPDAVIYIGLAVHELLMNSLAYGVLHQAKSNPKIKKNITIHAEYKQHKKQAPLLTLRWTEIFDKSLPINPDFPAQFGRAILEKIVPTSLNGAAMLKINRQSVIYTLTLNAAYFTNDK